MNNSNATFREWYAHLEAVAAAANGNVADMEAWEDPYQRGLTPEEAWQEEWGTDPWPVL